MSANQASGESTRLYLIAVQGFVLVPRMPIFIDTPLSLEQLANGIGTVDAGCSSHCHHGEYKRNTSNTQ